jgi:hypothetical protein
MLRRIATLLLLLVIAGQALAGGIACGVEAISSGLNEQTACTMQSQGDCEGMAEMACCALGQSPTGSMAAMICCEVKCGESTGGAQFNFTPQTLTLAPPVVTIRVVSLVPWSEVEASTTSIPIKSAENNLLHHNPPDLFLSNATFLI